MVHLLSVSPLLAVFQVLKNLDRSLEQPEVPMIHLAQIEIDKISQFGSALVVK